MKARQEVLRESDFKFQWTHEIVKIQNTNAYSDTSRFILPLKHFDFSIKIKHLMILQSRNLGYQWTWLMIYWYYDYSICYANICVHMQTQHSQEVFLPYMYVYICVDFICLYSFPQRVSIIIIIIIIIIIYNTYLYVRKGWYFTACFTFTKVWRHMSIIASKHHWIVSSTICCD